MNLDPVASLSYRKATKRLLNTYWLLRHGIGLAELAI